MFEVLGIAALVVVFTLFLSAMAIGLAIDQRRIQKANKELDDLRREMSDHG